MPDTNLSTIQQSILRYLADNPEAADSLVGIAHWWLNSPTDTHELDKIELALDALVQIEYLSTWEGPDQRIHYRLHPSKRGSSSIAVDKLKENES